MSAGDALSSSDGKITPPAPSASAPASNIPHEVGWQFVPQYYTFINKHPHRLHCFYKKNSTFIHGTEGEDGHPYHGQQEIHQKITQIGFQDCKVFIHSVDAHASADNGIIVQVIGEMSNRGEAWRKFVQTFFLAEQPGGYFVLNDIFRYLKEESVEDEEVTELEEQQVESVSIPVPVEHQPEPEPAPPVNIPAPAPVPVEQIPEPIPEPVREPSPVPVEEPAKPQPNGLHPAKAEKEPEPIVEPPTEPEPVPEPEPVREPTPTPAPVAAQPSPSPAPAVAQPSPAPAVAQPAPIPVHVPAQPAAPPVPKTWANLAATNPKKWGSAVAQESRGMSVEVVAPSPPPPAPRSGAQTPVSTPGLGAGRGAHHGPKGGREAHPAYQQAMAVTTPHVFVKGVVDPLTDEQLKALLLKYGKINNIEYVRTRACAFVEYEELESAKRAIVASLPVSQGGEGGIRVDVGQENQLRIIIETKKERGERPPPRNPRGGTPGQGGDRGGFRGRGRGRGIPAGKTA
ncbi:hypothetical protein M0805_002221 [Coniferiporia weirii]|nr:hypothetical protein M0805_002221 [Coniferiporia weirii]